MNMIGLVLAASGHWGYPRRYSGAFVVGNFSVAILMRNELFGRILYLTVNTLFAKVALSYFHPLRCTDLIIVSGPLFVFVLLALRYCSTSEVSTQDARFRDLSGCYIA